MNATDIESQVGAAVGLWTHTPVDWAGNEGASKASGWPNNASQGYLGLGNGTRPGQGNTQTGAAGGVNISEVKAVNLTVNSAGVSFVLSSAPTSCRVNYGTTLAMASNAAGTNTTGGQTVALSGLTTKTTYYFQVQATNAQGTTFSNILTFTTF